jgi:phage tail tape-measure protein
MSERGSLPRPAAPAERRRFLKVLGAAAVAPLLGAGVVAAAVPGAVPAARPAVVPGPGGVFIVNGWVLTGADLDALGLRAA